MTSPWPDIVPFLLLSDYDIYMSCHYLLDKVLLNAMVDQVGKAGVLES